MSNNSKSLKYDKIIFAIIILLVFVSFFFPFKIIDTIGGYHSTLFGSSSYVSPSTKSVSGFGIPLAYGAIFLIVLASLLMMFSKKKAGKIISLIVVVIYTLYLLVLYLGLNFHIRFFGPKTEVEEGFGFYILLVISGLFVTQIILTFLKSFKSIEHKKAQKDLLDDL